MKSLIFFFCAVSIFCFSQTKARVIGIKDGDTVSVLLEDNTQKTLRLAEVDCPEKSQDFGTKARAFTASLIFGKTIEFVETNKDRYRRTIAKVYFDGGKYLSEEIIRNGLGWWYAKYSKNTHLKDLEKKAKAEKIGLWKIPNPTPPWEYRKTKSHPKAGFQLLSNN